MKNINVVNTEDAPEVQDVEFTDEESKAQLRANESDILKGLMGAADYLSTETTVIQIARKGKVFFSFSIRPLSEKEYDSTRNKHSKFKRNKTIGIEMPKVNTVAYHTALIYMATTEEDKKKIWDNRQIWDALSSKGKDILTGTDVIDAVLLPGEKDMVLKEIDKLSGYQSDNFEEITDGEGEFIKN